MTHRLSQHSTNKAGNPIAFCRACDRMVRTVNVLGRPCCAENERLKAATRRIQAREVKERKKTRQAESRTRKREKRATMPTALLKKADALAREFCKRDSRCEASGYRFDCSERLEWCHLVSRDEKLIRHDPRNSLPMCRKHHKHFTQRPREFTRFIEDKWPGRWDLLDSELIKLRGHGSLTTRDVYERWIQFYEGESTPKEEGEK